MSKLETCQTESLKKAGWNPSATKNYEKGRILQDFDLNQLMRPRKICVCRQVSEEDIRRSVREGACSFKEVSDRTGASTNCGTCKTAVISIIEDELSRISGNKDKIA